MEKIVELLPILIPFFLIELGLRVYALIDIWKQDRKTNAMPKWAWTVIVGVITFGWVVYLLVGRAENDA